MIKFNFISNKDYIFETDTNAGDFFLNASGLLCCNLDDGKAVYYGGIFSSQ